MVIYCTTNLVNGRKYIGLDTRNSPKYLGSGKAFKLAVAKYGKENFRKDILTHCKSLEELLFMEEFYISRLNAVESKRFYNLAIGGGKVIIKPICQYDIEGNLLNCWDSIKAAEYELGFNNSKITAAAKGGYGRRTAYGFVWRYAGEDFNLYPIIPQWNVSNKHKKILSNNMKGSKNPMYNKKGKLHPRNSEVIQYALDGNFIKFWDSLQEASDELKINNISAVCRGLRKKAGGYKWKYFKEIVQSSEKSESVREE